MYHRGARKKSNNGKDNVLWRHSLCNLEVHVKSQRSCLIVRATSALKDLLRNHVG